MDVALGGMITNLPLVFWRLPDVGALRACAHAAAGEPSGAPQLGQSDALRCLLGFYQLSPVQVVLPHGVVLVHPYHLHVLADEARRQEAVGSQLETLLQGEGHALQNRINKANCINLHHHYGLWVSVRPPPEILQLFHCQVGCHTGLAENIVIVVFSWCTKGKRITLNDSFSEHTVS